MTEEVNAAASFTVTAKTTSSTSSTSSVANPKTGSSSPIAGLVAVLMLAGVSFGAYKASKKSV